MISNKNHWIGSFRSWNIIDRQIDTHIKVIKKTNRDSTKYKLKDLIT